MDYNSPIHGLVTRESSVRRIRKTHWGAGFVKAAGILAQQVLYAATKPKARSPMGFLLFGRFTRQGASANGPAWAAPKKHRNPYTRGHTAERPFWQGPHENQGQVVRQPLFRDECLPPGTLDSVQDTGVGRGKIAELVLGYHPWGTYGQVK